MTGETLAIALGSLLSIGLFITARMIKIRSRQVLVHNPNGKQSSATFTTAISQRNTYISSFDIVKAIMHDLTMPILNLKSLTPFLKVQQTITEQRKVTQDLNKALEQIQEIRKLYINSNVDLVFDTINLNLLVEDIKMEMKSVDLDLRVSYSANKRSRDFVGDYKVTKAIMLNLFTSVYNFEKTAFTEAALDIDFDKLDKEVLIYIGNLDPQWWESTKTKNADVGIMIAYAALETVRGKISYDSVENQRLRISLPQLPIVSTE